MSNIVLTIEDLRGLQKPANGFNLLFSDLKGAVLTLKRREVRELDEGETYKDKTAELKATNLVYVNSVTNKETKINLMAMLFSRVVKAATPTAAKKALAASKKDGAPALISFLDYLDEGGEAGDLIPVNLTVLDVTEKTWENKSLKYSIERYQAFKDAVDVAKKDTTKTFSIIDIYRNESIRALCEDNGALLDKWNPKNNPKSEALKNITFLVS